MSPCRLILSAALAGIFLTPALAQVPSSMPPITRGPNGRPSQTTPPSRQRKEPCWEVAGIPKSALEQKRVIAQQTKQEVEAVCANSSLTIQQKHQQIRAIHEREKQQMEALITPQQQAAVKACQESRGHGGGRHGGFGGGGHGMGPCGEMPSMRGTTPPVKGTPPAEREED